MPNSSIWQKDKPDPRNDPQNIELKNSAGGISVKQDLHPVHKFFESKSGLIILGFLFTTVCGAVLNYLVQVKQSEHSHNFEMYRTRLSEAKLLQTNLLTVATDRCFQLNQIITKLHHPEQCSDIHILNYWDKKVAPSKDRWNRELYYLHGQTRTLFSTQLSGLLLVQEENPTTIHDYVVEKLDERKYEATKPKSLHGAFVNTHATVYHLIKKCSKDDPNRKDLLDLAKKQLAYLELIQSCLTYRISGELLQYPYGPKSAGPIVLPQMCSEIKAVD